MSQILVPTKTTLKVIDVINWAKEGSLRLSPEFQRRSVWKDGAKSFLIDTVVRGFPIPIVFLRDRPTDTKTLKPNRDVIDGQQRLRTLIAFIIPEDAKKILKDYNPNQDVFTVNKSHNEDIGGLSFADLNEDFKQAILNYEFTVHIISSSVDNRDIYSLFRRLNSTNFNLKGQELLNSQWFGQFKTSQYALAEEQIQRWKSWGTFTDEDIARMSEVELTSELCVAILEKKISGKSHAKIKTFYKDYDDNYPGKKIVEERFRATMDFIDKNFGKTKSILLRKRIFYVLFIVCYDLLFGLDSQLKKSSQKVVIESKVQKLHDKAAAIRDRTAKKEILNATDRRTTNIKERNILFDYLKA